MASISWTGGNGDWTNGADWTGGTAPGASDTALFTGSAPYTVTLYSAAACGNVTLNAPGGTIFDDGLLTLAPAGVFALNAGTLDLAYGTLAGGTLQMNGGMLKPDGGTLNGVAVHGTLGLTTQSAALLVQNGLAMGASSGAGPGTIALTGNNASLTFIGSQSLTNAAVALGAAPNGAMSGGAASINVVHQAGSAAATLTLARSTWLQEAGVQAQMIAGGPLPSSGTDTILNAGTITAATSGGTLLLAGPGNFINQGTIAVSNGATLEIATGGFSNTGTMILGGGAVLDLGGTFTASRLSALGPLSLSGASVEIGGDLLLGNGTLSIGASTALGPLGLAGTITGGTVQDAGGGFNLAAGTGVLDGTSYKGSLTLGQAAALTLADSASLSGASGGTGTASLTGAGAVLLLESLGQTQTVLDNAVIALGASSGTATLGTTDPWNTAQATVAVLGPHLLVNQTGKYAAVDANDVTGIPGYGPADTLINQGTIAAAFAGGTLTLGGAGTLINAGTITAGNAADVQVLAAAFSNTGTILVSSGATLSLGGPPDAFGAVPAWSNTGVIALSGGTLALSGAFRTSQIGHITETGAGNAVSLTGTLANTGQTLSLGGAGLPAITLSGTIAGGSVADPAGLMAIGNSGAALLDGVSFAGTLNLSTAGAWLRVKDGLVLNGAAFVTGSGAELGFQGSQTFDKANVVLGAAGTKAVLDVLHDSSMFGGSTLTLGPFLAITQGGPLATIGSAADQAADAIISYGTITAGTAGGTLALCGANWINRGRIAVSAGDTLVLSASSFANFGTLALNAACLSIGDSLSVANLGNLVLAGGSTVSLSGTLNDAGGTLSIGAGTAWGRLSLTGTIAGGTILDYGGGLGCGGGATLDGVTYSGVLDLSRPFAAVTLVDGFGFAGGASQPGTILLTGAATRVLASTTETLDNATILLGNASQTYGGQRIAPPELAAAAHATLTIGAGATVRSAGLFGWLGDDAFGGWTDTVVNRGTILAASQGGILTLGSSFFVNAGGIAMGNGDSIGFAGVSMTNAGVISVSAGSAFMLSLLGFYEAPNAPATVFTNSGTLRMLGGAVQELTGNGLFPAVPFANTGLIQGLGNVLAPIVNSGVIEGKYGPNLGLSGAITGTGVLQVDSGCVLELGNAVAASQTVTFTGAGQVLRLDDPAAFAARVAGFATGDTLDIAGSPISAIAVSAGTLVLGTNYGQLRLATTTPVGGEFSVGADTHGGSTVAYTAQAPGSGVATIAVGQPKMLFWASPVGDAFTGACANLSGASVANWTAADILDFTDLNPAHGHLAYTQGNGIGTLTVNDGVHASSVALLGSYTASGFHLLSDGHGGAQVTYSQT